MTFGIEMAALAGLPFAAAIGLGAALSALDMATQRSFGFFLSVLAALGLIAALFACLTQTAGADVRLDLLAIAPLTALVGLFVGYGLRRLHRTPRTTR